MTAPDVSTMLRCGQKTIIFLINNGGYTIEVEIHDGPYNVIKNWNYTGLVDAIHNGQGKCWTTKVIKLLAYILGTTRHWHISDTKHDFNLKCLFHWFMYWLFQVTCEEELVEAIATATGEKKDSFCFIEVITHKDDTSKELLEWGSRVCSANSRPPNPQWTSYI